MTGEFNSPIAIRAYSERPNHEPLGSRPPSADQEASEWTLLFDCETTVDAAQKLNLPVRQEAAAVAGAIQAARRAGGVVGKHSSGKLRSIAVATPDTLPADADFADLTIGDR